MAFHHSMFAHLREGWQKHKKPILITTGATTLVVLVITLGSFGYVMAYDGKIYPNVHIGSVNVGGMTQAEASEAVQEAYNSMLDRGVPVRLQTDDEDHLSVIDLRADGSTDPDLVYDLITMNFDVASDEALNTGRETGNVFVDTFNAFYAAATGKEIFIETTINDRRLEEAVRDAFAEFEMPGEKTDYEIEIDDEEILVEVVVGEKGYAIDTRKVFQSVSHDVQTFQLEEVQIGLIGDEIVELEQAESLAEDVQEMILAAPYELTYESQGGREFSWTATDEDVADWIYPSLTDDGVELSLAVEDMEAFLEDIRKDVDIEPQNARFQMDEGRVVEFAGSLDGVTLDEEETIALLSEKLGEEEVELAIAVETVEPDITTESVNSLGITEIVGVGVSDFSGSPSNRRSNIDHGAEKLNGLLIAPGEEFSLVEALSPFTISDGWLPELVIKGDEIKPEVGGGACQFGTTLFRAAMNSGLEITQRRNHSLVVGYYNDPSNGNPGTDATIYDPAPDFRFRNDTENYLLLTTSVDQSKSEMVFTFWGTSDGRKGYYTPPEILAWTGYGATVEKETDSLPPGVRRCQAPHSGAQTSFDYIVEYADGETFEHTYTSTYRSLPTICLVGKSDSEAEGADVPAEDDLKVENPPADEPLEVEDVPVDIEEE